MDKKNLIKYHTEALECAVVVEWSGRKAVAMCEIAQDAIKYLNGREINAQDIIDNKLKELKEVEGKF